MAHMSRNIFVLFLLCVVLLIIVGVAFPSYLSKKNIKFRSAFNSSIVTFNALSKEKLVPESLEADIFNTSLSTFLSTSNKVATEINTSNGITNSSLIPNKVKRRAKRRTSLDNDELFDWNFNLSVTRYRKGNTEKSKDLYAPVKRSGVAVHLESKEPKTIAFNEMQVAFKSVKSFLRDFFKVDFENALNDTEEKKKMVYFTEFPWVETDHTAIDSFNDSSDTLAKVPDMEENLTDNSLDESLQSSTLISSENSDKLKSESGNNDSSAQTDREPRIFFGLFGSGESSRKTTSEPEKIVTQTENIDRNISINENLSDSSPRDILFVTSNSQDSSSIHIDSSRFETEKSEIDQNEQKAETTDRNISINENLSDSSPRDILFVTSNSQDSLSIHTDSSRFETRKSEIDQNEQKAGKSDVLFVTQQTDCPSCSTDKTRNTILLNEDVASETTSKPIEHFTDKTLRNLCIQVMRNLKESQTPISGEKSSFENRFVSSQNLSTDSSISTIPKEAEELNTHIVTGGNIVSREESPTEKTMALGKQARFLNFSGLGTGRSEIINEGNIIFEKEPDEPKFTNLPSASDCEKFSKDWNVEVVPKQNHTSDFNSTHITEFLENNPILVNENTKEGFNSDENKTSFSTEVDSNINNDQREVKSENANAGENVSSNKLEESQTDSMQKDQNTTDGQREGKNFSFFDSGSGDGRDANWTGSHRSLNSGESDERTDIRSDIPTQENVFIDKDYSSEIESSKDIGVTPAQEHRIFGIFSFGGSGEGREIADSTDSITEYNVHNDCANDCSHRATEQPYECNDDCDPENDVTNSSAGFSLTDKKGDCEGNCNTSIVEMRGKDFEDLTSESFDLHSSINSESFLLAKKSETKDIPNEATDDGCDDCDYENFKNPKPAIETEAPSYITEPAEQSYEYTDVFGLNRHSTEKFDNEQSTENSEIEHGTTEKKERHLGPIFLTGSGDGGLFGDDGKPINLVKEQNMTSSNRNPRRRGRLDDEGRDFTNMSQNPFDSSVPQDLVPSTNMSEDSFEPDKNRTEDFSPKTFSPSLNITQIQIPIQPRSCSAARDCNVTLNERCITVNDSPICACGRSFVRHKETGICVAKRLVETSLRLPEELFDEDLRNPDSPRYKQMSEKSIETIYLLLNKTPYFLRVVTDVNVAGFASGSLIVKLKFVLAAEKDSSQNLKDMEKELQKALKDENVLERASLNVRGASFQPLKSENVCKSSKLNSCSKYADCIRKEDYPGYSCKCKEHYIDASTNSFDAGEICVLAKCPASFCGTNGHCEVVENDKKHCICYGLYFGDRCEYPGVVILGSLSVVALISLIFVFVVILKLRYRSTNYGRTPTFRRADTPGHAIANCRVSDAIALGESREMKVAKFTQISTPVPEPPLIKVTRPTLNESSISFDCDSTFNTSNNTNEKTV